MKYQELASKVRTKYPGAYDDLDDKTLAQKIVAKYPDYADTEFDDQPGMLESGARGLAQGLTLGHADELTGALESATSDKSYKDARDESRANYDAAKSAHPVVFGGAEALGSVPGYVGATAVTGGNPIAGAALAGGVQAEGNAKTPLASMDTAKDVALGSTIGAATGAAGEAVSRVLNPGALNDLAETQAAKATGAKMLDFKKFGADKMKSVGRTMLDNDVLTPLGNAETMQGANEALNQSSGKAIGDFLDSINETIRPKEMVDRLAGLKADLTRGGTGGYNQTIIDTVDKAIDTVQGYGNKPMSFELANHIKGLLQGAAKWHLGEDTLGGATARQSAGVVRGAIDDKLENISAQNGPEAFDAFQGFKANKETYGNTEIAKDLLNKKAARENGNLALGPMEMGAGILEATATGSPMKGLAAAGVWKAVRHYGSQNTALLADWMSKNEASAMQSLGKWGPALITAAKKGASALAVTHYVLSQQDPAYRQQLNQDAQ